MLPTASLPLPALTVDLELWPVSLQQNTSTLRRREGQGEGTGPLSTPLSGLSQPWESCYGRSLFLCLFGWVLVPLQPKAFLTCKLGLESEQDSSLAVALG